MAGTQFSRSGPRGGPFSPICFIRSLAMPTKTATVLLRIKMLKLGWKFLKYLYTRLLLLDFPVADLFFVFPSSDKSIHLLLLLL
jgi:hypothetical protein